MEGIYISDLPGADQVANARNQGQTALNGFDPTATANNLNAGFNQLKSDQIGSGPQNGGDYLNAYSAQVAKNPTVTSLYNTANQQFNVPQQQQQATYLQNQVNQAVPQAYNLARGFDVSDAQVQNQANTNLRFLQPEANAAQANANTAAGLATNYVQAGQAQNTQNLLPIQSYQATMNQALAAQATGFTQDAQNQFAGLQAKMQAGVALSTQEMQTMAQLTQAKEQYDAAIAQNQAAIQQANIGAGKTIQGGQVYYNPTANNGTGITYDPFRSAG